MTEFTFFIDGHPQPAGSKKWLPSHGKTGGRPLVVDANSKAKPWQSVCSAHALQAMRENGLYEPLRVPLELDAVFYRLRPSGHLNSKGELNAAGRRQPAPGTRPDRGKLLRAIEDAFQGVIYSEDSLVVGGIVAKRWGPREGVHVRIRTLEAA